MIDRFSIIVNLNLESIGILLNYSITLYVVHVTVTSNADVKRNLRDFV